MKIQGKMDKMKPWIEAAVKGESGCHKSTSIEEMLSFGRCQFLQFMSKHSGKKIDEGGDGLTLLREKTPTTSGKAPRYA